MHCEHKNSYLQLVTSVNPRIINRAVDAAMGRIPPVDPHDATPPRCRMTSMVPSHFAPNVDVTRCSLGFGTIGLKKVNRDLHAKDSMTQMQAVHTVMDLAAVSEKARYLLSINCVFRLIDLILHKNPTIREKVCMTLKSFATLHLGRMQMLNHPKLVVNLMTLITSDKNAEIRYAAAFALMRLARDRFAVEQILKVPNIVHDLLKQVKTDHVATVLCHLLTLEHLFEWDQEDALKENAFQIMLKLMEYEDPRLVDMSLRCMTQIMKHPTGKELADECDMVYKMAHNLLGDNLSVIKGSLGVMQYATLTTRSRWRAKERAQELCDILVNLCTLHYRQPPVQLPALRVLINLSDMPDIRKYLKKNLEKIKSIPIRTDEEWDGFMDVTSYGTETALNCQSMVVENTETIHNDFGDNPRVVNVHSYLGRVKETKEQLIKAINFESHKFDIVFK